MPAQCTFRQGLSLGSGPLSRSGTTRANSRVFYLPRPDESELSPQRVNCPVRVELLLIRDASRRGYEQVLGRGVLDGHERASQGDHVERTAQAGKILLVELLEPDASWCWTGERIHQRQNGVAIRRRPVHLGNTDGLGDGVPWTITAVN